MKADLFYLEHILDCIHKIERFCKDGEARFFESDLIQDAVLRNLQVLGESTKRLSEGLRAEHPTIDWRGVAGFRNILVHDYFGVNLDRVWQIITLDLPILKTHVEEIRKKLAPPQ